MISPPPRLISPSSGRVEPKLWIDEPFLLLTEMKTRLRLSSGPETGEVTVSQTL